MGPFRYPVDIGDPHGERFARHEALVDTGAAYSVAPASVLEQLGVRRSRRARFLIANGDSVEQDMGETRIRVDGDTVTTIVVFGPEQLGAVLGAYSLEGLGLSVDVVGRRLVRTELFPMLQGAER